MYQFSEDAIREAAYYIWKNNGCQQGTSLSDWDAAINQLSAQAAFAVKVANKAKNNATNTNKNNKNNTNNKTSSLHNVKSIVLSPLSALKAAKTACKTASKK